MSDVINTDAFWTVRCDHPECEATYTATKTEEPAPGALDEIESAGWHIGSEIGPASVNPDYCPEHAA